MQVSELLWHFNYLDLIVNKKNYNERSIKSGTSIESNLTKPVLFSFTPKQKLIKRNDCNIIQ